MWQASSNRVLVCPSPHPNLLCALFHAGYWYRIGRTLTGVVPPGLLDALRTVAYRVMSDDSHLTPMQRHQRRWNRLNDSRAVLATCYGARFASIKDYAAINAHVLAMVGDKDLTTPPAATMAIYRALQRAHGPHTLPGMGHLAIVDAAELVAALLNRFFSKHAGDGYVR